MRQTTTRLLNDDWSFRELDPAPVPFTDVSGWLPAEVPGHVHLDLMRIGIIPDPFERMYERTVQWVDETDWAYRRTFTVSAEELADARHILRFGGLDTLARVLLNGELLGEPANMFVAHEFDVTSALCAGENTLEVQFRSAQRAGEDRKAALLAAQPELAPYERGLMPRSFTRKAQYMYGWDWGPCLRGCGIWQDVELVRVPAARVRDWSYAAAFSADGACRVTVRVWSDGSAGAATATLTRGEARAEARAAVADGVAELALDVPAAQRWWPAGYGEPVLYELAIALEENGEHVDTVNARVGLRAIELVREPDAGGESFFFRVNGVPIFAKGANWIPADSFPARVTPERYREHLELAQSCGMNMLRIWGGGIYETEPFYSACDELGLLVWQDFPFACALYPDDEAAAAEAYTEAVAAVRRLRHHPSLALYCGNNENQMLAYYGLWGELTRVLGDRLYDEVLPRAVAEEDPTRPYWPGSPYGSPRPGTSPEADPWAQFIGDGGPRGPNPNSEAAGDCHYWNVWHGAGDWKHYAECTARFVSEFGFAAPPDMRMFDEALRPADQGVDTPAMRWHDKTLKGYETYLGFIALHYPAPTTLPDLVYYGQLNQAEGMKFGIEHFRRLRPHTMGTLVWQLNDCWPVQSWAWLDHRMRPKAAWYYARRFYAPLLLSLAAKDGHLTAHLVNDGHAPIEGTLAVRALDSAGAVLWEISRPARAEAAASVLALEAELPPGVLAAADRSIIHATFGAVQNTLLLAEPKEMRLGVPRLRVTTSPDGDSARVWLASDELALSVMLWLEGTDAAWSDNFFHLLPGTAVDVHVRPAERMAPAEVAARLRWRAL
jgi:beta-mannosidase